jgi:hypothetical protein
MNEAMADRISGRLRNISRCGFVYGPDEWSTRAACPPGYQLYNADLNAVLADLTSICATSWVKTPMML